MKDLYSENYKVVFKKIGKEDNEMERYFIFMYWKNQHS